MVRGVRDPVSQENSLIMAGLCHWSVPVCGGFLRVCIRFVLKEEGSGGALLSGNTNCNSTLRGQTR